MNGRFLKSLRRIAMTVVCLAPLAVLCVPAMPPPDPGRSGPYAVAKLTITTTNSGTGSELETDIHYPSDGSGVDPGGAPYPALVFAHGTSAPRTGYSGNADHLASWGFIVALPSFPDNDIKVRGSDVRHLLSYLEAQNGDAGSPFYKKIDPDRFSVTGHSLGGASIMLVAARDERVELAAVPLDPVNPDDNHWDYIAEGPDITAPVGLIGSPSHMCNWNAKYKDEFPSYGSTHKAKFVIVDGGHCDFMDADNSLMTLICGFLCGGFSESRLELIERYTAAWFNYYVRLDADYYTYLYGAEADADIQAGLVNREAHTAPRDVAARVRSDAVELSWALYDHPIIAGYNIYRSQKSGDYPTSAYAQVGRESSFVDGNVVPGQRYFYVVRSRDAAGNEHQVSEEVSAAISGTMHKLYVPMVMKSHKGSL